MSAKELLDEAFRLGAQAGDAWKVGKQDSEPLELRLEALRNARSLQISAVDTFMKAVPLVEDDDTNAFLRQQVQSLLGELETITAELSTADCSSEDPADLTTSYPPVHAVSTDSLRCNLSSDQPMSHSMAISSAAAADVCVGCPCCARGGHAAPRRLRAGGGGVGWPGRLA